MADVKWIKLYTNMFDNRKIKQIEMLPDGDALLVIWLKLLTLAGNVNDSGFVYFTKDIPYTDQMLSVEFNKPLSKIQLALTVFQQYHMIDITDDILKISNWEKYQNIDRLTELREYNRIKQQEHRARKKLLTVNDKSMTSQSSQDTDIDKDIDIELDINNIVSNKEIDSNNKIESNINAPSNLENCTEPSIIGLSLNDNSIYPICQKDIDEWKELYQAVDILQELKKMKGWLNANPKKRKTKSGIKRFINAWLSREQDKPHIQTETAPKKDEPQLKITAFDVEEQ